MPELTLSDGRTLAYELGGDPDGAPVVYQHGVPGSRLREPLDRGLWQALGVLAVSYDRPGYGGSTRYAGRSVADCVGDVVAIADALGIERFRLVGVSGGAPHALAVATLAPERVVATALVVPFAPLEPEELALVIPVNRSGHERASQGVEAVAEEVAPLRDQVLADPVGAITAMIGPAAVEQFTRAAGPDAIERAARSVVEGLRPGPEGWTDDSLAVEVNWSFTPRRVECPLSVWFGDGDTATPASAVLRLAESVGAERIERWPGQGHLASALHERDVLEHLLAVGN